MNRLSSKHLDEAVATGVITSDQRKGILELAAQDGTGRLPEDKVAAADDEPFEIFQGFAEIFVALGLVILLAGVGGLIETMVVHGLSPFVLLLMSCGLGHYYARHRRMTLPSIVSLLGVVTGFVWLFSALVDGAVLGFYTDAFGDNAFFVNALIIGLLVTSLGTWWRGLRQIVMSALPAFPGKDALAPYMPADGS